MNIKPTIRRKRNDEEHLEQCEVIEWVRRQVQINPDSIYDLIYAIPNGGKRDIHTATKLKNEGVKRGIPDLHFPVARGGYNSLYIEMKCAGGTISADQKKVHAKLTAQGNKVILAWQSKTAIECLKMYVAEQYTNTEIQTKLSRRTKQ